MSVLPELAGVRHDYLDAGGLRMHVALAGADAAPPVLLVHGWPQHWWCWRKVLGPLAENHRVIAVDLRGHGWTERTAGGYEKEQLTGDLLALLDAMGLDKVTWIGHDWGAYSGFLAALRSPERIERMLALSIPHPWTPRDPRLLAVLLAYQGPLSLPVIGPRVSDPLLRRLLQAGRGADRLGAEDVERFASRTPPATTVAMYRSFLTRDLPAAARGRFAGKRLGVPTRLLAGARDLVTTGLRPGPVPRQPNLSVEVVPGVGHWIPEQRPDLIVDWARRV
ncbi:MAG TPA: alpha/beta fold hydrolase [Solirubrobacteraceae bacterium]|jgi:pimeloyl-ACP methyl ester carboxylesterase|nr:alpha/beta fold hydrolase [Solirubrobacteraceae bacterium]